MSGVQNPNCGPLILAVFWGISPNGYSDHPQHIRSIDLDSIPNNHQPTVGLNTAIDFAKGHKMP